MEDGGGQREEDRIWNHFFMVLFVKMNQVIDKRAKAIPCSVNSVMFKREMDIAYIVIIGILFSLTYCL